MQRFVAVLSVLFVASGAPVAQADNDGDSKKAPDRNYNLTDKGPRGNIETAKPYVLNVKNYNLTPEIVKKFSIKALLKYRWKIEADEATRWQGSYTSYGIVYKTEIRFTGDTIVVGFVPDFHDSDRKWLSSLANTIKKDVNLHRRETNKQRNPKQ